MIGVLVKFKYYKIINFIEYLFSILRPFQLSQTQELEFDLLLQRFIIKIILKYRNNRMATKQIFKIGEMIIDQKQIFWKMQYCYALIPIVQLLDGHILLTTNRPVQSYIQLEPVQIFDLSLTINFLAKSLESFHGCQSTNIHIQNATQESACKQMIVHIIPRKTGDLKNNDYLYEQLETYPADLVKQYNEKMNFYVNAYANKILEGIHEQSKKYEAHLNLAFKQEKET